MCKLRVEVLGRMNRSEMHPCVKGFFKPVTAQGTPERLAAQT